MQSRRAVHDTHPAGSNLNGLNRFSRGLYLVLAWALVLSVAYQTFLAGMAVFVDASNWARHTGFVHVFEMVPILLLVLAFTGRMPRGEGYYLWPVVLWVLIAAQYAFAAAGATMVAALHPVNALVIFWISHMLARKARRA